jgi:hypothetical protein
MIMNFGAKHIRLCQWILALTICLGTSLSLHAQVWKHAVSFGGTGSDVGVTVKIDQNGNRYLTGYFSGRVNPGINTLLSAGDTDIFLGKYGQWILQIGGVNHDEGSDIAFDGSGNVYLTGWFTDSAAFHSTDGSVVNVNGSSETIFLAKYSPAGVLVWVQTGTDTLAGINRGHGVAVDAASGAVYLTGISQGSTLFSSSDGTTNSVPGPGTWHMYLVKYTTDGNFQWGEWNEAAPNSIPHKVALDANGSAYVTGWFEGQATFHSNDGNDQTIMGLSQPVSTPPDYPDDSFVVKYDRDGNLKWVNDIGGYKAITNDIAVSSAGEVSVTGFIGNIDGTAQQQATLVTSQLPGTTINLGGGHFTNPYNRDILVATYDSSGVALNALRIGGVKHQEGGGIIYSGTDLYVSGLLEGTGDLFIAKITGGALDWMKRDAGPITGSLEVLPRIAFNPNGTIVAIGAFLNTATFGPFTLQSHGAEDVFLADLAVR